MVKRKAGRIEEKVLRCVDEATGPASGMTIVEMFRSEGEIVRASQVFRAIRRLVEVGKIRKLLVAGGYVLAREAASIDLYCSSCGRSVEIPDHGVAKDLLATAAKLQFAVSRYFIENRGMCCECAKLNDRT